MALTRISTNIIADSAISNTKIADGSINTAKLVDSAVSAAKLADNTISSAKLVDSAVSAAKLADGSVTTSKVVDNALSYAKLAGGAVCNVWFVSDAGQNYANNTSGFTWLEITFTPAYQNSKFLVICTINGAANDDASGYMERYQNGGWGQAGNMVGSGGWTGSWGDWSITRATEDKQNLQYSCVYIDQPNTAGVIGYRARNTCENTAGFYSNRSMGWDGGYNSNTSRSSMLIMEIKV